MATALLVIDVQEGLFTPPPARAEAVIAAINGLIDAARACAAPIVFIQHEDARDALTPGSPGWQRVRALHAQPADPVVRKTTPNSFLRTGLADLLNSLNVDHLVVCGYATEFCVDTTVRQAAALGYAVTLASDAHTTHDKPHASAEAIRAHHNATLSAISSFGVPIVARPAAGCIVT